VTASITQLKYKVQVNTLEHLAARTLALNEIGVCNLGFDRAVAYDSTFFGRDLLTITPEKGYALVQHDRDVGLFDGEQLAVLSAPKTVRAYRFEPSTKRFSPAQKETAQAQSMILDAISFYQTAFDLYMRGSYKDTSDEGE
jgi:hypothetical protein